MVLSFAQVEQNKVYQMKYQPKQIQSKLDKINLAYEKALYALAGEVMEYKIKPLLIKKQLSFAVINGNPRVYDRAGFNQAVPKEIINIFDNVRDIEGYTLGYKLPDFNPFNQDFNQLDIDSFNRRNKNTTENESILSCMMAW